MVTVLHSRNGWSGKMSGRGLYRTKMPDGLAEYARVVYGIASPAWGSPQAVV